MYPTLPYSMIAYPFVPLAVPPEIPDPDVRELPAPGRYRIDPAASRVIVTARVLGVRAVRAEVGSGAVSGTFRVAPRVEDSGVSVRIAPAGLSTGDDRRDADLHGPRGLDVDAHPVLHFTAASLTVDSGAWVVPGHLDVRGAQVPVALRLDPVQHTAEGTVILRATATVDRRAAGVTVSRVRAGRWVRVAVEVTARRAASAGDRTQISVPDTDVAARAFGHAARP